MIQSCAYCGLHELELCSPMVYGQSRAEHEQWVQLYNKTPVANGVLGEETTSTTINFLYRGEQIAAPKVHYPYLPLFDSVDGRAMQLRHDATDIAPTIVHQMCALHMFHARVHRSKLVTVAVFLFPSVFAPMCVTYLFCAKLTMRLQTRNEKTS